MRAILKEQISLDQEDSNREAREIRSAATAATQDEEEQRGLIKLLTHNMSTIKDIFKVRVKGGEGGGGASISCPPHPRPGVHKE